MHDIVLADDKQIIKKTNIDLLQLIERTGGFHDGLVLVFGSVVAPFAATQYLKDFVKDAFTDKKQSIAYNKRRKKIALQLESHTNACTPEQKQEQGLVLLEALRGLEKIKLSVHELFINMFCRFLRGHKGYSKIQRLADYQTAQLDIRNLISNSIALKDFFRCGLTLQQRLLIAKQRTRIAECEDEQA